MRTIWYVTFVREIFTLKRPNAKENIHKFRLVCVHDKRFLLNQFVFAGMKIEKKRTQLNPSHEKVSVINLIFVYITLTRFTTNNINNKNLLVKSSETHVFKIALPYNEPFIISIYRPILTRQKIRVTTANQIL